MFNVVMSLVLGGIFLVGVEDNIIFGIIFMIGVIVGGIV